MYNNIVIKVYNKQGKLKLMVQEAKDGVYKAINIHQHEDNIEHRHSFTIVDVTKTYRGDIIPYYEYIKTIDGVIKERLAIANQRQEHEEKFGEGETVKSTTSFVSGKVYENRRKEKDGKYFESQFTNGELVDFDTQISEIKIKEYLETLSYGTTGKKS
jgi:hypothetical protein